MQPLSLPKLLPQDAITPFEEINAFIQFGMADSHYALDISDVNEIIELPVVIPYPQIMPGHLGIVNLGGRILPVIDYTNEYADVDLSRPDLHIRQLLVACLVKDAPFGLIIKNPRRFELGKAQLGSSTININGIPVRILSKTDFETKEMVL